MANFSPDATTSGDSPPRHQPGAPPIPRDWPLVGYADPWSVAPGEQIRFMVSCERPTYRAEVVRLLHGDDRPGAPGVKEEPVATDIENEYAGRAQPYPTGSSVVVPDNPMLRLEHSFTLTAWILPTTPDKGEQGLLTKWSSDSGLGYALVIDQQGQLALWLGDEGGEPQRLSSGVAFRAGNWYLVAAAYDAAQRRVLLCQRPFPQWPLDDTAATAEYDVPVRGTSDSGAPFVMAAWCSGSAGEADEGHFNGKIEAPTVYAAALGADVLERLAGGDASAAGTAPVLASWDLALDTATDRVRDVSGNALDGRAVNLPARGMSGHRFGGGKRAWPNAPETHGALYFHDDDL